MENNNGRSGGNFFSGFLLGVLVGAAVVFLLGTKKGKKILKAISEEGAENISTILKKVDETVDLDQVFEQDEESSSIRPLERRDRNLMAQKSISRERIIEDKPKARRFFRGISRHAN